MPRIFPILLQNSKQYQKRTLTNHSISSIVWNAISVERICDNDSSKGKYWKSSTRKYMTERNGYKRNNICLTKKLFVEQKQWYYLSSHLFSTTTTESHSNKSHDPQTPNERNNDNQNTQTAKVKVKVLAQKGATKARKEGSKMKELFKKYGWYFGGTYFGVYLITLGSTYTAIDSGFIDTQTITSFWGGELGDGEEEVDAVKMVVGILDQFEWTRPYTGKVEENPKLTTLGVAWLATKILEPLRIVVAGYFTPKVARIIMEKTKEESSK